MKTNYSSRDWELLSEYIDQQLHPSKQRRLEARLQQEPELRAALEDLRRTRAILRSAPKIKAPRNFTLKPHMVPQPAPRRVYPVFQFASALASVLFVLVLVGDLLGIGFVPESPVMMAQPAAVEALEVEQAPGALALPAAEGPVDSAEIMIVPPEEVVSEAAPDMPLLAAEEEAYPGPQPGIAAQPFEKVAPLEPSPDEQASRMAVPEYMLESSEYLEPEQAMPPSTWRYLQVSFALLALVSGGLAVYLKRIGR
jgi:hypothetical protein